MSDAIEDAHGGRGLAKNTGMRGEARPVANAKAKRTRGCRALALARTGSKEGRMIGKGGRGKERKEGMHLTERIPSLKIIEVNILERWRGCCQGRSIRVYIKLPMLVTRSPIFQR